MRRFVRKKSYAANRKYVLGRSISQGKNLFSKLRCGRNVPNFGRYIAFGRNWDSLKANLKNNKSDKFDSSKERTVLATEVFRREQLQLGSFLEN